MDWHSAKWIEDIIYLPFWQAGKNCLAVDPFQEKWWKGIWEDKGDV